MSDLSVQIAKLVFCVCSRCYPSEREAKKVLAGRPGYVVPCDCCRRFHLAEPKGVGEEHE